MVIHWTRKQQGTVFHHSSIHCWLWWRKLLIGFQHFKTRFWNQQDLLRCEHKSINLTQFTWLNATQTHAPWHSVLVFVHCFLANTGGLWVFIFFSTLRCIELWSHYEVSNKFYFIYVNIHQQAKCQKSFIKHMKFIPILFSGFQGICGLLLFGWIGQCRSAGCLWIYLPTPRSQHCIVWSD